MVAQFPPFGQQRAVVESSRLIHVEEDGQQKFEGRLGSEQRLKFELGHEAVSRWRIPRACAALIAEERALAEGTVEEIRQIMDNFCSMERRAMI